MTVRERLDEIARERIVILDGAMGSMIQSLHLGEEDFRGSRFAAYEKPLKGCNDLLCLTKPEAVSSIHEGYLKAGADIIETCSLNSTSVALGDYGLEGLAYEISAAAARLGREAADRYSTPEKPRFVAGSIGPTSKSASISPDMNDPGKRGITWDELEAAYCDHVRGLLDGGADILIIETIFDTLNAKAALFAISRIIEERRVDVPLMISATVAGPGGRLLSGQTVEAFCVSVLHARPWSLGLNCSFGAEGLKEPVRSIAAMAPCLVSAYPNAGMPNQFGGYDESPETMAASIDGYIEEGLVNIVGGCCGSTPAHIAAIAAIAEGRAPRPLSGEKRRTLFAGLEVLRVGREQGFTDIGERTNVAGSRKFLRLVKEENYAAALDIAREMIDNGAAIIDICMDDALLDPQVSMIRFLNLALADPGIAKAPVMVDSSRWEVIEAALKCIQGKALVNSISLKDGEGEFLRRSRLARRYGAAVVVMLFDEAGQALTFERKIEIARRSYRLLCRDGFSPEDIVFDPNVLTIATGIPEHDAYALDFIRACRWISENCPFAQISGGISNLSFSFRGNEPVREAMHAVFLKHALDAGLTMAIVNPAALAPYDGLDPALREAAEKAVLCKAAPGEEPSAALLQAAVGTAGGGAAARAGPGKTGDAASWRSLETAERIVYAMIQGLDSFIEADTLEMHGRNVRALDIVEGPLMEGMREVGERFGQGRMFLPQVIRSARVMKKAVSVLEPFIQQEKAAGMAEAGEPAADKVLLATVKGDVHDIGKNIVAVVLGCNGYSVVDLGVMVPAERILEAARREKVRIIGLSALISPSLDEMVNTAREMEKQGFTIPLMVGGAAASLAHTALRIAPEYSGPVIYTGDAGEAAEAVRRLLSDASRPRFLEEMEKRYQEAAERYERLEARRELISLEAARKNKAVISPDMPPEPRIREIIQMNEYPLERVLPYIDWPGFLQKWDMNRNVFSEKEPGFAAQEEARAGLLEDARKLLARIATEKILELRFTARVFPAFSEGDDIVLYDPDAAKDGVLPVGDAEIARFCFPRSQGKKRAGGANPCLADFIAPRPAGEKVGGPDWLGLFALSAGFGLDEAAARCKARHDDYEALLLAVLAGSLAEAFAEELHLRIRRELWGFAPKEDIGPEAALKGNYRGIRPAFGYPACPDHKDKEIAFELLEARKRCGLRLTDTAMIIPEFSLCGMIFAREEAFYFGAGNLGEDQIEDLARRKGITTEESRRRFGGL